MNAFLDAVVWGYAFYAVFVAGALLQGRLAPSAEDVIDMARPVLSHRMALNFAARARGDSLTELIETTAETLAQTKAAA